MGSSGKIVERCSLEKLIKHGHRRVRLVSNPTLSRTVLTYRGRANVSLHQAKAYILEDNQGKKYRFGERAASGQNWVKGD